VPAGTIGRVSASSPARDAQRRRAGETVQDAVVARITHANEETGYRDRPGDHRPLGVGSWVRRALPVGSRSRPELVTCGDRHSTLQHDHGRIATPGESTATTGQLTA
jgi:hypothetical protein